MPTLEEWKRRYAEKTGEEAILAPDYRLLFDEEYGFVMWKKNGVFFDIDHVCTNHILYWLENTLAPLAKSLHCTTFRAVTLRNPSAFTRLTKARLNFELSTTRRNGKFYWAMEKNVDDFLHNASLIPTLPDQSLHVRRGQIGQEIFTPGISAIHVTGQIVRMDLMTAHPQFKSGNDQPAVEINQRLIMSLDGFIQSLATQQDIVRQLVKAGVLRKNIVPVPE